jgi:glycosyltransferase involved in cell wall biosynthesis
MRTVAIIPVYGRLPLLRITIERLLKKNGISDVICVGGAEEKATCKKAGALYIEHENILSNKWNAGFKKAKELKPDYCVFVGSSDWLMDNYISVMLPKMCKVDMVGVKHFYQAHVHKDKIKLGLWLGYGADRESEPIGIGRILSGAILDKIGWQPFEPNRQSSMDYYMFESLKKVRGFYLQEVDEMVKTLSISTDLWGNKHTFGYSKDCEDFYTYDQHPTLLNEFPELITLQKELYGVQKMFANK